MIKYYKNTFFLLKIILLVVVVITSFKTIETENTENYNFYTQPNKKLVYTVSQNKYDTLYPPFLGKSFTGFKQAIAFKESRGQIDIINKFGYLGKFQFGKTTLKALGITNIEYFLQNEELQDKAFESLLARNKSILQKQITQYAGKTINNVVITESGLLAAAHLGGPGSVKRYLKTNGRYRAKDSFGTSIKSYIKKFGYYDVSHIKPIETH